MQNDRPTIPKSTQPYKQDIFKGERITFFLLIKRMVAEYYLFFLVTTVFIVIGAYLQPSLTAQSGKLAVVLTVRPESAWQEISRFIVLTSVCTLLLVIDRIGRRIYQPRICKRVIEIITERVIRQDRQYFQKHNSGAIVGALVGVIGAVDSLIGLVPWMSGMVVGAVSSINLSFRLNNYAGIILVCWLVIFLTVFVVFGSRIGKYQRITAERTTELSGMLSDVFDNMPHVQSAHAYRQEIQLIDQKANEYRASKGCADGYIGVIIVGQNIIFTGITLSACLASYILFNRGLISVEVASQFIPVSAGIGAILGMFGFLYGTLMEQLSRSSRYMEILGEETDSDADDDSTDSETEKGIANVKISNLTFAYPGCPPLFQNLSVEIPEGRRIGLVGRSGSGKSTLVHMIMGYNSGYSGEIFIGGEDVKLIKKGVLRGLFAYVPQKVTLLQRSIRANIVYGCDWASQEEIENAARQAHAHDFINKLPQKYDTIVTPGQGFLSGGQQQRLIIARAILRLTRASLLVVDEGASSLDSESESLVSSALDAAMKDKTSIIIAHRLSTLKKLVDIILVMDEGRIVEMGTHDELMQAQGLYQHLWESANYLN